MLSNFCHTFTISAICTWDDDYKKITLSIIDDLLELAHVDKEKYTAILMQGSGTFGVESVLTSVVGEDDCLLICANGAYGKRMAEIAQHAKITYKMYLQDFDKIPDAKVVEELLQENPV